VYDYDILSYHPDGVGADIAVSVFPKTIVEGYLEALRIAHIEPVSFEIESRSIARSIVAKDMEQASLVVDFGRARTGIAILKGQVPIFTSTVEVGGDTITNIIMKELKVDETQAEAYKNEHGITIGKDNQVAEVIMGTAAALADEIVRHHRYWDSLRNETGERVTPIAEVLLTGGSSNLRGLPEYIAARVQSPTLRADVWRNVCLFDRYIPSVTSNHALGLSTVIGLALRGI
jgi:type IV pilus assembly protein PilM